MAKVECEVEEADLPNERGGTQPGEKPVIVKLFVRIGVVYQVPGVECDNVDWEVISEAGAIINFGTASSRAWAERDSGLDALGSARHALYPERFPQGFELIEAPGSDPEAWLAVQAAMALRRESTT